MDPSKILKSLLVEFEVDDDTLEPLVLAYRIEFLKSTLELLIGFYSQNEVKIKELNAYLEKLYSEIPSENQENANKLLLQASVNSMAKVIGTFTSQLPPDLARKIKIKLNTFK